jgi:hypothetical protein
MLSVTYEPLTLGDIMSNVIMLSVVAPSQWPILQTGLVAAYVCKLDRFIELSIMLTIVKWSSLQKE